MCGRLNVISDPLGQLILEITGRGFVVETHMNLAPTEPVPVLVMEEGAWDLRQMRWWLTPFWSDGPGTKYSMFNARSETLARSRAFREPFARRRSLVPASGYFEWRREGSVKQPFYVTPTEAPGFAFAAVWDRWEGDGTVIESCAIVTTAAPPSLEFLHHRMPVHLTPDEANAWVDPLTSVTELNGLMAPTLRMPLRVTPVSTQVNNARNKDARCTTPIGEDRVVT
ncbi:MAG: SOS response-associated peptidase [Pseudomonadota bacterium]